MSNNTVTKEDIDWILERTQVEVTTFNNKTTVMVATLPSGFVIVESSSCVDPANYDEAMGKNICMQRIENKVWELEGYVLQKKLSGQL